MIQRNLRVMFVFALLLMLFGCLSVAQTTDPCKSGGMWYFPDPMPAGCYVSGPGQGNFSYQISCVTSACPPPPCLECSASAGGGGGTGSGSGTGTGSGTGSPISLATGNTSVSQQAVSVPGLGGGLNLTLTWNSMWPQNLASYSVGLFGSNWRSTYEERVFVGSDYYIKYSRGDGTFWSFGFGGPGYLVAAPANVYGTLVQDGVSWTLTFQNGERRKFSFSTGFLTSIIDRNGNTTQLAYDSSNRLTTVTSAASQHLYFNYGNATFPNVVTGVTSDFGTSLSYGYDTQGRLTQITKPDLTTVSLTYDSQSRITAVTDNNGKVLESHTYDSNGRGLTFSQANGVNALTVTYLQ